MKYRTVGELNHFIFKEAFIGDTLVSKDRFHLILDNVTILPENSCNRDIRDMRCNEMMFTIENPRILSLVEEGYKMFDADGNLKETCSDVTIEGEAVFETIKGFREGSIYDLKKEDSTYTFYIDAGDRTYLLRVEGTEDMEEWDRFLNKEICL